MTRRNWKWLVCLSLVVGSGAIGGKPLTPPFPYDGPVAHSLDGIARINAPDVVVASVVSVPDAAGTNGEPPVVKVEIEAVLKGELGTGSRKIIWAPSPFESDSRWTRGPEGALGQMKQQWEKVPIDLPKKGERFILAGDSREGRTFFSWLWGSPFRVEVRGRLPATPEWLAKVKDAIERGKAEPQP